MKRIILLALCFLLAFTLYQPAFAAGNTITWTGESSDNWNVAGNWNPAQVPGLGDTAVIPETKKVVVYDTTSVTLDCSGEVSVESDKTLWLTGTSYLKGNGKLSGDGNITIMVNDSELQWSGGSIEGNGTFSVAENTRLVIDTVSDVGMVRPLENNGQVMLTNGNLLLIGGGTGTGTYTVSGGAHLFFEQGNYSIGGDFVNRGETTIWDTSSVGFGAGYWQEDESTLVLKVWGDGSDQYCKLDVAGAVTLGGILEIDFIDEYDPSPGDSFEIVTYGSRANEFFEIRNNMEDEGITLVPTYTATGLTLTVSGGAAKIWEVANVTQLETALNGFQSGDTIKLLNNITYTSPIEVDGKTIYFELGDYDLLVDTSEDLIVSYVLTVKNGGKVKLAGAGTGKFSITSSSFNLWEGVRVLGANSEVTVNNVDVTGESATGVYAKDGNVVINGDITAGHRGVATAVVAGTSVTVNGNIAVLGKGAEGEGIYADEKTTIYVTNDVTVQGTGYIGVHAAGGTIEVGRNVVSSGIGAKAKSRYTEGKGEVKIHGSLSAGSPFIIVGTTEKTAADITEPITETGFLTYSDGVNTVWIGSVGDPVVTAPTAPQSFAAAPGDGQVALSWAAPTSDGGSAISRYEVSGDNGSTWVTANTSTTHTFTGLSNGTEYYFKVRAVNSAGNGAEASVSATPAASTGGEFAPGSGDGTTPETAFLIATPEHLNNVRNYLGAENANKHFKLTTNLDLNVAPYNSDKGWVPIGTSAVPFTGSFDGSGYTISGLFIKRPVDPFIGLFANIGLDAKIWDVGLINVNVTGYNHVGGLAGRNRGQITNSYVIGNLTGEAETGGLVGENSGPISDSYAQGTVTDKYGGKIGGLVGENTASGTITNCYAKVEVTVTSSNTSYGSAGGLVGYNFGGITESHAVGAVVGRYHVGGLAGTSTGTIDKSYATGTVTGTINYDTKVGGLVGHNDGSISNSFARGDVSGDDKVGGLVGFNKSSITSSNKKSLITTSYATGKVNGNSYIGGLAGYNYDKGDSAGIITDSYWDKETSLLNTSGGGTGKTTEEMKQQITYVDWDFTTIWGINDSDNDGYPFLKLQGYEAEPTAPSAPQTFTATPFSGLVKLSWDAPASDGGSAIIKYQVSKDNGASWTDVGLSTSYTFAGLTNGTEYTFKVRAENGIGSGAEASQTAIPDLTAPSVPRNFTATPGDARVRLDWDAPATHGGSPINKYQVSKDDGANWEDVWYGTTETFTGLTNGTEYTFKVRAVNYIGNGAEASVSATPIAGPTVPTTPQNFIATPSNRRVDLSWTAPASDGGAAISRYEVSGNNGGTWITASSNTAHTFTGLTNGTAYFFKVRAVNSAGNGAEASVSATPIADPTVPTKPQNFIATPSNRRVDLSWTAPASDGGAAIIRYEVSGDNGSTWVTANTSTTHTFTGLTNGTAYIFKVRAVNGIGSGAEASATATPIAESAPTYTVTVTNGTGGGSYEQGVTVTITANLAPDGQRFKEWQVISGGITLVNSQEASTSFQMPANAVAITAAYEPIPAIACTVTVNGSYAAVTGAGSYVEGATVTIDAGIRANYSFNGWTSPDGVPFTNVNNATTTFIMPGKDVTITANWNYNGSSGDSSDGESSIPTTPAAPAYKADVKAGSGTETTIPVTVDKDAGTASVDAGSQGLDKGGTNITIPSIPDVDTYSVGIPVPDLSTSDVQGTLTVNTDAGNVTVPSNMLTGVSSISGSKAEIAIGQGDKSRLPEDIRDAIGDKPLIRLTLLIDGNQTDWSNRNASVTVSIPYTPTAAELANPESIVVWYIDGAGRAVSVPNGRYDSATGMVIFTTTQFSGYAVAYNKVSFSDVAFDAWYNKAVSFIAARGITGGTGNGNYSPDAKLTRGEFVVLMMRAYDIALDKNPTNNFSDAGNTYYTGYLAAAKRLGITAGVGNNMFAPEKEITRQEMFTLLYNALKVIRQLPWGDSDKTINNFTDAGQIAAWAKEAITLLVKTGIVGGSNGTLTPLGTTTRAEMAQVLYNLLNK